MTQAVGYLVGGVVITLINLGYTFWYNRRKDKKEDNKINRMDKEQDFKALVEGFQQSFAADNEAFRKEVLDRKEELSMQLDISQKKYAEVEKKYNEVLKELTSLHSELRGKEDQNEKLQKRVKTLEDQNKTQHKEITKLQAIINNMKKTQHNPTKKA